MAFDARLWSRFEIYDAVGKILSSAGRNIVEHPIRHSLSNGEIHDQTHSVATVTAVKLFDIADDIASFSFLAVVSDQAGQVQLVNNGAALFFTMGLVANFPFMLASDAGEHTGSVGAFDGTADAIEAVYFYNSSAVTASVRIVAAR